MRGRIDIDRQDTVDLEGRLTVATQTPGSPLLAVPNSVFITSRPTIISEGATLGGTHTFNRLAVNLRATFDRTQYGDASQSDGLDLPLLAGRLQRHRRGRPRVLRGDAGAHPFRGGRRRHPRARHGGGPQRLPPRLSVGVTARAGSAFEFTRLLTGTLSAGYADRRYADPRLPNLRGPTVDGALVYAFTPLTTITGRASTALSETTLPGASGAISRSLSVELAHVFFRNFTVTGIVTYQPNEYQGVAVTENFLQFTLKGGLQPHARHPAHRQRLAPDAEQHAPRIVLRRQHLPPRRPPAALKRRTITDAARCSGADARRRRRGGTIIPAPIRR